MKKFVSFLAMLLFLAIPFSANATLLGNGQLNVSWSPPTAGGYYADYDGTVVSSNFGYSTDLEEIFCVSHDNANAIEFVNFYTITPDLNSILGSGFYEKLAKAAWIADNWTSYGTSDTIKGEAQKAVWEITGVITGIVGTGGTDYDIYNAALNQTGYLTSNWLFAYSPGAGTTANYQDYLTPYAPVPEPATMLLFGTGLIGLMGFRKKFKKA